MRSASSAACALNPAERQEEPEEGGGADNPQTATLALAFLSPLLDITDRE